MARRPDIPLLLVEARAGAAGLAEAGFDPDRVQSLRLMRATQNPRDFYGLTQVLVMPSLVKESFGLAAAEAMLNGIPVLASDRGALTEVVGEAGFVLSVPEHMRPDTRIVPSATEVEPWVETIIRLWDDTDFYRQTSERARGRAQRWTPEQLGPVYREFFEAVAPQPGPPLLPLTPPA